MYSKLYKGKKRPEEVCRKISQSKMGHVTSEETKRKIGESRKKHFFYSAEVA